MPHRKNNWIDYVGFLIIAIVAICFIGKATSLWIIPGVFIPATLGISFTIWMMKGR